jgi:hypothetical protein
LSSSWSARVTLVIAATLLTGASSASAAVSNTRAGSIAIKALKAKADDQPVIVFRSGASLAGGTKIAQAGGAKAPSGKRSKLGVVTTKSTPVLTVAKGHRAYLFYADFAPYEAFAHRGRLALVDVRTGAVRLSTTLSSPPVVGGKLPFFMRSGEAYNDPKNHIFETPYKVTTAAGAAKRSAFAYRVDRAPLKDLVLAKKVADQLAADHSCSLRVSDTFGEFYDFTGADDTRARLGDLFYVLAQLNKGFIDERYSRTSGETPAQAAQRLISEKGCKDIFFYAAGRGYSTGPGTTLGVGTRVDGTKVLQQTVTAADLTALVKANPAITFSFKFDAPYSRPTAGALAAFPNVLLSETAAGADGSSFGYLPEVFVDGKRVVNTGNPDGLLEFTNRTLSGINRFLSSEAEVDAGLKGRATGATPSLLALLLGRAFELGADDDLPAVTGIQKPFFTPTQLNPTPPPAPPAVDQGTVLASAGSATTDEDTPVAITLGGAITTGAAPTYSIETAPLHGTLSGTGASQTYTPAKDFSGTDSFVYGAARANGSGKVTATVSITVNPVNDQAVVTTTSGSPTFTEAGPAVAVDPTATVTDVDDTTLVGATIAITAGKSADDILNFTAQAGITGIYSPVTGVLTLAGTASVADYQAAIRSITFEITGANPAAGARTITFRADDGKGLGAPTTRVVAVSVVNDPPVLAGSATPLTYTENDPALAIGSGFTISDPDSPTLAGATVSITGGYAQTEDRLAFTAAGGITGTFDVPTGVLQLSGSASIAAYESAIAAVTYANLSDDPSTAPRTLTVKVDDGAATSNALTVGATVAAVNDAPTLATSTGAASYTENAAAVAVDPAVTAADPDNANLSGATVSITAGFDAAHDSLTFVNGGGITGSYSTGTGVLTLSGSATKAAYQSALRSITFATSGDDPSTATRTVSFRATDGALTSAVVTRNVSVAAVNDAPTLTLSIGSVTHTEGAGATVIDNAAVASDLDNANLAGATVQITTGLDTGDVLGFTNQNGITGTYTAGTGLLTLSGSATVANYQAALRTITYATTNDNPTSTTRVVTFKVNDGALDSAAATRSVLVVPTNDAPTLTASANASGTYTEASPTLATVDSGLTVTDPDSTTLASATATISTGFQSGDVLDATVSGGVTKSYNAATGVLTLTGSASLATYQTILRTVAYGTVRTDLASGTRTISFVGNDGTASSAAATKTVNFTAVNTAPVVTASGATPTWTEGPTGEVIDPAIAVSDTDNTTLTGASVTITNKVALDELLFTNQNGISGSYNAATGVLSLTGTTSLADYQTALRSVEFRSTDDAPDTTTRTFAFVVDDGTDASTAAAGSMQIVPTNDAPTITVSSDPAGVYTEGDAAPAVVDANLTLTDPDSTTITGATATIRAADRQTGDKLEATASLPGGITATYTAATGVLAISGNATAAVYEGILRTVSYSSNRTDLPNNPRRIDFDATDDAGDTGAVATKTVNYVAINSAPVVTTSGGSTAYTEAAAAVVIDGGVTVADTDDANLIGAKVTIGGLTTGDTLTFTNQNGITGSYNSGTGVLTLTGTTTVANYQTALRSVKYANNNLALTDGTRSVDFQVTDPANAPSAASAKTIAVTAVNNQPVVTLSGSTPSFTEGDPAVLVDGVIAVSDPDSANLSSVSAVVQSPVTGDQLALAAGYTLPTGLSATGSGTTTLTISGNRPLADYQAALQHVTFFTASENPRPTAGDSPRKVRFTATDSAALASTPVDKSITVTGVNDAPIATADAFSTDEDSVVVDNVITHAPTDSDPDGDAVSVDQVLGSTANVGQLKTLPSGAHVTIQADGTLTYDPQGAFDYLQAGDPDATDTFTYRIKDPSGLTSSTVTETVTISGVNDAPFGVAHTYNAVRNTALELGNSGAAVPKETASGSLTTGITDTDDDPAGAVVVNATQLTTDGGGKVDINASGTFLYTSEPGESASTDHFNYQVQDTHGATRNVSININLTGTIWYVDTTPPTGTANGTSTHPFTTVAAAVAAGAANDQLYVAAGTTPAGVTLKAGQDILGEGAALTATLPGTDSPNGTVTLAAAGTAPTLTSNTSDVLNVTAGGSVIRGLNVNPDGTVDGIHAASASPLQITDVAVNDTGTATSGDGVDISASAGSSGVDGATLSNVDITTAGAGTGLRLANSKVTSDTASTITAVGGPAVNATGTIAASGPLALGAVSSSGSPTTAFTASGASNTSAQTLTITNPTAPGLLVSGSGDFTASNGSNAITGSTGTAFEATTGSSTVTLGGTISPAANATGVNVNGRTGGSVAVTGALTTSGNARGVWANGNTGGTLTLSGTQSLTSGSANGVDLTSNGGATVNFTGGSLAVSSSAGKAFNATGGGTVNVTGGSNFLATTTGTALTVANTTIGASNLTFSAINANGGPNGIVLDTTGSSGRLAVTGDAGTTRNTSGGVINASVGTDSNTTTSDGGFNVTAPGSGIYLKNTASPSFEQMSVTNAQNFGILAYGTNAFTFTHGSISGNGNNDTAPYEEGNVRLINMNGTATFNDTAIQHPRHDNIHVTQDSGTGGLTMTGNAVLMDPTDPGAQNDSVLVDGGGGSSSFTASITGSNTFTGAAGDHVQISPSGSGTGTWTANIKNSSFTSSEGGTGEDLGGGLTLTPANWGGQFNYDIDGNTIVGANMGYAINDDQGSGNSTMSGYIRNNTVGLPGDPNSGSAQGGDINVDALGTVGHRVLITNNVLHGNSEDGIRVNSGGDGQNPTLNATITGNTIDSPDATIGLHGIEANIGTDTNQTGTNCVDIRSNTVAGGGSVAGGGFDIRMRQRQKLKVNVPGYTGASNDNNAMNTFLQAQNPGGGTPTVSSSNTVSTGGLGFGNTAGGAPCPQPTN